MHGPAPFVTKLMQAVSIMDRMVGKISKTPEQLENPRRSALKRLPTGD
jgi:hypothetical protein